MEAEHARDLGFAAVRHLVGRGGGPVVTAQAGAPRFVPLASYVDPVTGRGCQRTADVASENYQVARAHMVRLEKEDLADDATVPGSPAPGDSIPTSSGATSRASTSNSLRNADLSSRAGKRCRLRREAREDVVALLEMNGAEPRLENCLRERGKPTLSIPSPGGRQCYSCFSRPSIVTMSMGDTDDPQGTIMHCKKDTSLTEEEREVFRSHLEHEKLSDSVWDLFGEWVARSTPEVQFFYLKAYLNTELVGLGLFLKVKPVDLRASYSGLRKNARLSQLAEGLSALASNCLYVSFRNLITSNLTRPFFFREPGMQGAIMQAFLAWLRDQTEADMVTIIDTATCDPDRKSVV
jgi:hypothetical protein